MNLSLLVKLGESKIEIERTLSKCEEVVIGRAGNGIILSDTACSRVHATIQRDANGQIWIVDQGSRNGTFLNGQRVTRASLRHGDHIQIGQTDILFSQNVSLSIPNSRELEIFHGLSDPQT